MNEIIKVTTNELGSQVVSARDLHSYLEVQRGFAHWFDDNREWFTEGTDYQALVVKVKAGPGTSKRTDYALTLDTAKELAMMSRVPKGKQARQYFIKVEKELLELKYGKPELTAALHREIEFLRVTNEFNKEQVNNYRELYHIVAGSAARLEKVVNAQYDKVDRLMTRVSQLEAELVKVRQPKKHEVSSPELFPAIQPKQSKTMQRIHEIVNDYVRRRGIEYKQAWMYLYERFSQVYGVKMNRWKVPVNVSKLEIIEQRGYGGKLLWAAERFLLPA